MISGVRAIKIVVLPLLLISLSGCGSPDRPHTVPVTPSKAQGSAHAEPPVDNIPKNIATH